MRHGRKVKKLGRTAAHRKAMLANMATSLIMHSQIKTTQVKARAVCRVVEKLVTLGKRGDLHARRLAAATIRDKVALQKLFDEIAPQFADRSGGYTRVLHLGFRLGDAAPVSLVQLLVEKAPEKDSKDKDKDKKKKAKAKTASKAD